MHNINIVKFKNHLGSFDLILNPPNSLPKLLDSYDNIMRPILEKHVPIITKFSKSHKNIPALHSFKYARRHLERKYISFHYDIDFKILSTTTNIYHK